jgi:hypothetical protein
MRQVLQLPHKGVVRALQALQSVPRWRAVLLLAMHIHGKGH